MPNDWGYQPFAPPIFPKDNGQQQPLSLQSLGQDQRETLARLLFNQKMEGYGLQPRSISPERSQYIDELISNAKSSPEHAAYVNRIASLPADNFGPTPLNPLSGLFGLLGLGNETSGSTVQGRTTVGGDDQRYADMRLSGNVDDRRGAIRHQLMQSIKERNRIADSNRESLARDEQLRTTNPFPPPPENSNSGGQYLADILANALRK